MTGDVAEALVKMTSAKCNIVVAGGTGSGKTSLLNVLAAAVPPGERVLVLEDTREINVDREHVVYLTARKPDERGENEVSIRDLFRASLRMRPDRIIVVRSVEPGARSVKPRDRHGGCLPAPRKLPHDTMTRSRRCDEARPQLPLTRSATSSVGHRPIVQVSRIPTAEGGRSASGRLDA